ncbi:OmpH family outer membrane protein [Phenylobacterium parvum]|uniref:Outer membrane chaperone Skp n=1 Tax=Phenylobacterium parvum TaxID=2201350 RepID=A0A2Z3HRW0_9CAUL|nr:OmpH family outer membrane protein [Phenylobacterium parvum]AWM77525.1 outer membrane chaperone Skp [Phenylobacterium parvum]
MKKTALLAATAAVLLASAPAQAQTPPAPPPVNHGPALAGVCILSLDGAIGSSTVGKYVQTRLQQISQQVQTELTSEQTAIQNEAKTLDAQKATMDPGAFEQKSASLQVRANAWQRKAQLRERELQATQQKALARVGQELEPVIRASYQQARCSLLLQRDSVILANPAMDITPSVITGLNAKITQFAFDRERLDQAAAAPAAAQPAKKP